MKGKKSLISEIIRINEIISGKKVITEATVNPIIDLVNQLVKMGTRSSTVRALQNQLKTKGTSLAKKIEIINQLRNSSDQAIKDLIISYDTKIILEVLKSIPKITRGPQTLKSIQKLMAEGKTKEEIIEKITKLFQKNYGTYADNLVDDFVADLGKAYDEIITPPKPEPPAPKPDDPNIDVGENISRDIFEVLPSFTKYAADNLSKGAKIADEITSNIELLAKETDGKKIEDLKQKIKEGYDNLFYTEREYISYIDNEIEKGLTDAKTKKDKSLEAKWTNIRNQLDKTQEKYGRWGRIKKTVPNSGKWLVWTEAWGNAWSLQRKIYYELFYKKIIRPGWRKFRKWLDEDYIPPQKVNEIPASELSGMEEFKNYFIWGSPRGRPKRLGEVELLDDNGNPVKGVNLDQPNAYKKIILKYKNDPLTKAWISLILEKLVRAVKLHLQLSFLYFLKDLGDFIFGTNKELMRTHGPCIMELSEKMKSGELDISSDADLPMESLPPCLIDSLQNGLDENTLHDMLIRANFFATSWTDVEVFQLLINRFTDISLGDVARQFLISPPAEIAYQISYEIYPAWIESQRTGMDTPLDEEINRVRQQIVELQQEGFDLESPAESDTGANSDGIIVGPDFDQ